MEDIDSPEGQDDGKKIRTDARNEQFFKLRRLAERRVKSCKNAYEPTLVGNFFFFSSTTVRAHAPSTYPFQH